MSLNGYCCAHISYLANHFSKVFAGAMLCLSVAHQPVLGTAISNSITVPVAKNTIFPGSPIKDDQISEKNFRPSIGRMNICLRREDVVGKVARRVILGGQPILLIALKDAELVAAGQSVVLFFAADGVEISGRALALQAGKMGDVIQVRNVDSGVVVRAVVAGAGRVQAGAN